LVNSSAASEYLAPTGEAGQWPSSPIAENIADEADSRVSPLTSLIVLVLLSLGTWAAIWAAFASLSQR
jgi:hypothetical protein